MSQMVPPPPDPSRERERAEALSRIQHMPDEARRLGRAVYSVILHSSRRIRTGNFTSIETADLERLFQLYDDAYFGGRLALWLEEDHAPLSFRLSGRMTRVGGTTAMSRRRVRVDGRDVLKTSHEITVSTVLLFNTFAHVNRTVTVGGLVCQDRLEALQRIFEHELLHLVEHLVWGRSRCNELRFQHLSRRIFGHAGVKHDLVTPREIAAQTYQVRVGDVVWFRFEGVDHVGLVSRINRRATVLVEDTRGRLYSNGKTYSTYHVPLGSLRKHPSS